MIVQLGDSTSKESPVDRAIDAGRSVMIFFPLDLGKSAAPTAIEHSIRVLDDKGEAHDIMRAPLPVSDENSIVVAPPFTNYDRLECNLQTDRQPPIAAMRPPSNNYEYGQTIRQIFLVMRPHRRGLQP